MPSPAPVTYKNASDCSNLVHVLVDSGVSDPYFDDFLIPELNRRLLDYTGQRSSRSILVVPMVGHNLFSVKTATRNGIVSISDRENSRLETFGVSLPLRGKQDDLCSFVLDLSVDAYGAIELAMNAVSNAQLWHRRLGHLNRRSLELVQRHDGKGITFDGTIADCDVCTVGKDQQLAHPKKA